VEQQLPTAIALRASRIILLCRCTADVQARYALTPNSALRASWLAVSPGRSVSTDSYITEDSTASPSASPSATPPCVQSTPITTTCFTNITSTRSAWCRRDSSSSSSPRRRSKPASPEDLVSRTSGRLLPVATQQVLAQYPGDAITQYVNVRMHISMAMNSASAASELPARIVERAGRLGQLQLYASREKDCRCYDQPTLIDQAPNT